MVPISISYQNNLRCQAAHGPSGDTLLTDAPADNMGQGQTFSPTDLVAAALGTCMATTMAIVARRKGFELPPLEVSVEKEMTDSGPRRIAELTVRIEVPLPEDFEHRAILEHAAVHCPVSKSLHPDVKIPVSILWSKPNAVAHAD